MLWVKKAFRDATDYIIALKERIGELEEFSRMLVDYLDPAGRQGMCAGKTCCTFVEWAQERATELGLHLEQQRGDIIE